MKNIFSVEKKNYIMERRGRWAPAGFMRAHTAHTATLNEMQLLKQGNITEGGWL